MADILLDGFFDVQKRESISVSIMNLITKNIITGKLKPGDRLPTEFEIAETLNVGRNSVREAIKMLSSLGVIEIKRGSGTFIAVSISPSMFDPLILSLVFEQGTSTELIELRLLIEMDAAELLIEKASDADIRQLEEVNRKLKEAAERGIRDPHTLRDLDLNVHYAFFDLTKNKLFAKIAKATYRIFYASIEKTVEMNPLKAYENHQGYIEAIKKRDRDLVKQKLQASLAIWIDYMSMNK
jgi:GntR family transcriptional repressor for pyruvate dehydrogenase complex